MITYECGRAMHVCPHCNKEVVGESNVKELDLHGECVECRHLHNIGVFTIDDYNAYLKGSFKRKQ